MQNGANMVLSERFSSYQINNRYSSHAISHTQLNHISYGFARREGRRKKPAVLDVKAGTAASQTILVCTEKQRGKVGFLEDWVPNSGRFYRELSMFEIANQWSTANRSRLFSVTEFYQEIERRVISEIVSGKAQAAVDLVELRKTRSMVADAGLGLFQAFKDLRAGRPFQSFVREMKRSGFSSYAGNKWLEYIYGWAPTISGAFETADVIASNLQQGSIVKGKVKFKQRRESQNHYSDLHQYNTGIGRATGHYQYAISDPKLLKLTQLGFTNPASIVWELLPWSFVLDWFVDVGGYINRMDFALGVTDIWWQYSFTQKCTGRATFLYSDVGRFDNQPLIVEVQCKDYERLAPTQRLENSFIGFKRFTNEKVRLTSALALINQQRQLIR